MNRLNLLDHSRLVENFSSFFFPLYSLYPISLQLALWASVFPARCAHSGRAVP